MTEETESQVWKQRSEGGATGKRSQSSATPRHNEDYLLRTRCESNQDGLAHYWGKTSPSLSSLPVPICVSNRMFTSYFCEEILLDGVDTLT